MSRLIGLIVVAGLLAACDENLVAPSEIVGDTWRLVSLQDSSGTLVTVDDPSRYTLRLEADGSAAVMSDCNSCGGSYSLNGSSLTVGPLVCTRVFCGDASLDPRYVRALESAQSVATTGTDLTIQGGGAVLRFRQ